MTEKQLEQLPPGYYWAQIFGEWEIVELCEGMPGYFLRFGLISITYLHEAEYEQWTLETSPITLKAPAGAEGEG